MLFRTLILMTVLFFSLQTCRAEENSDLFIFVSFSIPEQSLQELGKQAKDVDGVLVFRGMYKNSMQETLKKILELDSKGVSAIIHPKLFEEHQVNSVPTFVLKSNKNTADKISGNLPLQYVLREFEKGGDNSKLASRYLKKLEGEND